MSHDRGCFCGKEKYEYEDCDRADCDNRDNQITFVNNKPGFYWVQQYKNEQQLTIARLTKHSGWEYLESRHSHKMINISPYKVIKQIKLDDEGETIVVPAQIVQMIEYRRAAFEYMVIANLLEMNALTNEQIIDHLKKQAKKFSIAHDTAQQEFANKNAQK